MSLRTRPHLLSPDSGQFLWLDVVIVVIAQTPVLRFVVGLFNKSTKVVESYRHRAVHDLPFNHVTNYVIHTYVYCDIAGHRLDCDNTKNVIKTNIMLHVRFRRGRKFVVLVVGGRAAS